MEVRVSKHPRDGDWRAPWCRKRLQFRKGSSFGRFSPATPGLRPDHRQHPLPAARPSLAPANLRLAGLRSLPELPGAEQIPQFLAGKTRGPAALGDGGACAADQAGGDQGDRRGVQAALADDRGRTTEDGARRPGLALFRRLSSVVRRQSSAYTFPHAHWPPSPLAWQSGLSAGAAAARRFLRPAQHPSRQQRLCGGPFQGVAGKARPRRDPLSRRHLRFGDAQFRRRAHRSDARARPKTDLQQRRRALFRRAPHHQISRPVDRRAGRDAAALRPWARAHRCLVLRLGQRRVRRHDRAHGGGRSAGKL